MPGWVSGLLDDLFVAPFFMLAKWFWDWCMELCTGLAGQTPEAFSPETWEYVNGTLYPWALGIGTSCMNLFFIIGFLKAVSNFHEQMTMELCIEAMLRMVVLNLLLLSGMDIIRTFFRMSAALAGGVHYLSLPEIFAADTETGASLFWWMFGFLYFLAAAVCAVMILLTVYGRYLKLYLLVIFYPIAMPAAVGGKGVEQTAAAWLRSFLSNVFEIVVIALTLAVAGRLLGGIALPEPDVEMSEMMEAGYQAVNSVIRMILVTASVKGAAGFMNKSFGL